MAAQNSISEILKCSEGYKSLRSEQDVATCLQRLGWSTTQSPYYLDGKTGKHRELDIAARGTWEKQSDGGRLIASINLFVEVKSNSDFHIVCAGPTASPLYFGSNEHWIGYSEEARNKIREQLATFHLGNKEILDFLHFVEKIEFPGGTMRTSDLRLQSPPLERVFSAFRETNGKQEKELDNSVLWRAILALQSAVTSAKTERIEGLATDFGTDLEVARRLGDPFLSATGTINHHASVISMYLPIVVTKSRLWSAAKECPEELGWMRLVQFKTGGDIQSWTDVVNFDSLEEYIKMQTSYFEGELIKAGASRILQRGAMNLLGRVNGVLL